MKKIGSLLAVLFTMGIICSALGSAGVIEQKQDRIAGKELATFVNETVDITYPLVGYLSAYGGQIPLDILAEYGWGVQIDRDFCIKANSTGDVDKVVFSIIDWRDNTYELEDTEAPWDVLFDVRTHAYNITATAYYMDSVVAEDTEGPIFYLQGLIKPPDD